MEIKIEDLKKGDVVLIGTNGNIKCVKLLRDLRLSKKLDWKGRQKYRKVLCSQNKYIYPDPYTRNYIDSNGASRTYSHPNNVSIKYGMDETGHNQELYIDFNYKNIYLIKHEQLC